MNTKMITRKRALLAGIIASLALLFFGVTSTEAGPVMPDQEAVLAMASAQAETIYDDTVCAAPPVGVRAKFTVVQSVDLSTFVGANDRIHTGIFYESVSNVAGSKSKSMLFADPVGRLDTRVTALWSCQVTLTAITTDNGMTWTYYATDDQWVKYGGTSDEISGSRFGVTYPETAYSEPSSGVYRIEGMHINVFVTAMGSGTSVPSTVCTYCEPGGV